MLDDSKRFFRYLTPGVVFCLEVVVLFAIADYESAAKMLQALTKDGSDVGVAFLALVASAGVGYVLSVIHHFALWHWPSFPYRHADHREWVEYAQTAGLLRLVVRGAGDDTDAELRTDVVVSRLGSWRVVCALWHEELGSEPKGKALINEEVNSRQSTLGDLAHGAGAVLAGSFIAVILLLAFAYVNDVRWGFGEPLSAALGLGISVALGFLFSVDRMLAHAFRIPEIVLTDHLRRAANASGNERRGTPLTIWIGESEQADGQSRTATAGQNQQAAQPDVPEDEPGT